MFGLDPGLATVLVSLSIFFMGVVFGKMYLWKNELVIENTIDYLINNGYVRWKYNDAGEKEILKLDEKDG